MDVTRGDRGSFTSRPRIAIMGEAGGRDPRRPWEVGWWPLLCWMCSYLQADQKKWRARVETGRCGMLVLRRVAALYKVAGRLARVGARLDKSEGGSRRTYY